ncbi:MAG: hypothetical protein WCH62_09135 [Candidatus Omnitrophota bacterium]
MALNIETAFIIAMRADGSFFATTNFNTEFEMQREAKASDIKHGCNDILTLLENNDLANLIVTKLAAEPQSESEKTASSMRQALSEKGIL